MRARAARRGMKLVKSRRRNTDAADFGRYWLTDATTGELITDDRGVTLADIAAFLDDEKP